MPSNYRNFNETGIPLAYFISFRCYGTWLHGDERGSVDHFHNVYGSPMLSPDVNMRRKMQNRMNQPPVELNANQRSAIEEAINETCHFRGWSLRAINIRTNHVHTVVSASQRPELIMNAFKANSTTKMIARSVWKRGLKPWSRHGSTRYLWTEKSLAYAIDNVINGQGDSLPDFDGFHE